VEAPDGGHERRVEVARLEAAVVGGEPPSLREGGERLVEPAGAEACEAEQALCGRQFRPCLHRGRELADGGLEVADREVGPPEEEPAGGGAGPAADERGERPDGLPVLAERVAAAAEVQQGERELVRGSGDLGEEVRGPAVIAAATGLDGLRVLRREVGPIGVRRRVPAFLPAS